MKYKKGDILVPVSKEWGQFHDQRIKVLGFDKRRKRYRCGWILPDGTMETGYLYDEDDLNEEQLDEVTLAKRIIESYE